MSRTNVVLLTTLFLVIIGLPSPVRACHDGSPLVLDLDRGGIFTTNVYSQPVSFDIDGDGETERVGWTNPDTEEGFLWIDLNRNGRVDGGGELFGDSSLLPTGEEPDNGFEALAVYDRPEFGGDGDGLITPSDFVWSELRIWVDRNHDGLTDRRESHPLLRWRIRAIDLSHEERNEYDGALNAALYVGRFWRSLPGPGRVLQESEVADIFFLVEEHPH